MSASLQANLLFDRLNIIYEYNGINLFGNLRRLSDIWTANILTSKSISKYIENLATTQNMGEINFLILPKIWNFSNFF